ncbi:protein with putative role during mitosis [Metarhizium rileyi]|uniref:Mitochondrial division protein 1 n=1 Tax=Metarhizium rileyi (strain RCEF 4871) TaxID=1649241 RepID=A0A5C6G382_METRR|nr:protein with putative role during mitosis [Metarhizium rileyi]TWU72017.1 protein with putative role during mitosis [Metarhizium rileyi]
MDLESRNAALQLDLDGVVQANSKRNQDLTSWLPEPSPRHSLRCHTSTINCVAFHPKYSTVASASDDCTIKIWDWETGELEKTIKGHTQAVRGVDYGGPAGGTLLASCSSDFTIKLWDPADDYKNIRTLYGHDHSICSIRFAPCNNVETGSQHLLISASGDQTIKLWNVETGYCVHTLRGHTDWVRSIHPSADGRYLISASNDRTARVWNISTTTPETTLILVGHDLGVNCCALAPVSSHPYLASAAGLKVKAPTAPDGAAGYFATGSRDNSIKIWDSQGTCVRTLIGHKKWVNAIVFHPGGKYLLSVADDSTLRCWDLAQGECVKVLDRLHEQFITCLEWAPQVSKDASLSDDSSSRLAQRSASLQTGGFPDHQIRCIIATASMDSTIKIFAK